MASLFSSRLKHEKSQAIVCNGGLGGFVEISHLQSPFEPARSRGSPRIRKRRPPQLVIPPNGRISFTTSTSTTISLHGCSTPMTPSTSAPDDVVSSYGLHSNSSSLWTAQYVSPSRVSSGSHLPSTPVTPVRRQQSPVELPDTPVPASRIPKKEYPPSPPSSCQSTPTPATLSRSSTEEGESAEAEMERLKGLSSRGGRETLAVKSTKAAAEMSLEELLAVLPTYSQSAIRATWLPAAQQRVAQIKAGMNRAGEARMATLDASTVFALEGLKSLDQSSKDILSRYKYVTEQILPLAERDLKKLKSELEASQQALEEAHMTIAAHEAAQHRDERLRTVLHYTLFEQAEILITFIEEFASESLKIEDDELVLEARTLIEEHERTRELPPEDQDLGRAVRLTEGDYLKLIDESDKLKAQIREYRSLAGEQAATIQSQSQQLDSTVDKLEDLTRRLSESKNHTKDLEDESKSLKAQVKSLQQKESSLIVKHTEALKKNTDLEKTVQNLDSEIAQKDEELRTAKAALKDTVHGQLGWIRGSLTNQPLTSDDQKQNPNPAAEQPSDHEQPNLPSNINPFNRKNKPADVTTQNRKSRLAGHTENNKSATKGRKPGIDKSLISGPMPISRPSRETFAAFSIPTGFEPQTDKALPSTPDVGSPQAPDASTFRHTPRTDSLRFQPSHNTELADPFINRPVLHPSPSHGAYDETDMYGASPPSRVSPSSYRNNRPTLQSLGQIQSDEEDEATELTPRLAEPFNSEAVRFMTEEVLPSSDPTRRQVSASEQLSAVQSEAESEPQSQSSVIGDDRLRPRASTISTLPINRTGYSRSLEALNLIELSSNSSSGQEDKRGQGNDGGSSVYSTNEPVHQPQHGHGSTIMAPYTGETVEHNEAQYHHYENNRDDILSHYYQEDVEDEHHQEQQGMPIFKTPERVALERQTSNQSLPNE